jgi:predicted amidophosphoribosyltransferase
VDIEAIANAANAANEAVVQLPFPPDREERRVFNRVYTLVSKVADEANAAVNRGNQLMAQLAAHLQRRKTES